MNEISSNHLRGHLETLILAALEKNDAHGFEILQQLEGQAAGALKLKEGSLYPALYRLEESGLVKGKWEGDSSPRRRGPRRRIYTLTAKGRRSLGSMREDWRQFVTIIGGIVEAT